MKLVSRFAVAAAAALVLASPASAQNVTYTTTGIFTAGNCSVLNTAVCTVGGSSITFASIGATVFSPTNVSYGEFQTLSASASTFTGVNFRLTVNQTGPSVGNFAVNGTLSGNLTNATSTVNWFPAVTAFSIGQVDYSVQSPTIVVPPVTNGGVTTIQGFVNTRPSTITPEPSTYALMLAGLAAMGVVARRRRVA